jgi:hypothetical protein
MSRARRIFATTLAWLLCAGQQHAFAAREKLVPSQLKDMPRWPIYIAIFIAICIFCYRLVSFQRTRQAKSKVFPKLSLRRRLYGPYSGGNCAKISFGSRHDA